MDADAAEGFDVGAAEQAGDADDLGEVLFAAEVGRLGGLKEDEFLEEGLFRGFEMGEVGIAIAAANGEPDAAGFAEGERSGRGFFELAEDLVERAGDQSRNGVGQSERGVDGLDAEQRLPALLEGGASLAQGVENFGAHLVEDNIG